MDFHQKFGMYIDIVEIWFEIANGQISSSFFFGLSARDTSVFSFPDDNLSKHQWIFTKLVCIDILEIWFGIANGLSARDTPIFSFSG